MAEKKPKTLKEEVEEIRLQHKESQPGVNRKDEWWDKSNYDVRLSKWQTDVGRLLEWSDSLEKALSSMKEELKNIPKAQPVVLPTKKFDKPFSTEKR